jgi:hypothetical protein
MPEPFVVMMRGMEGVYKPEPPHTAGGGEPRSKDDERFRCGGQRLPN